MDLPTGTWGLEGVVDARRRTRPSRAPTVPMQFFVTNPEHSYDQAGGPSRPEVGCPSDPTPPHRLPGGGPGTQGLDRHFTLGTGTTQTQDPDALVRGSLPPNFVVFKEERSRGSRPPVFGL